MWRASATWLDHSPAARRLFAPVAEPSRLKIAEVGVGPMAIETAP